MTLVELQEVIKYMEHYAQTHTDSDVLLIDVANGLLEHFIEKEWAIIAFKSRLTELEAELEDTDKWDDNYNYGYCNGMVDAYKETIAMLEKEGEK
jgi:hypothetical protein